VGGGGVEQMSHGKISWNGFIIKVSMKNHKNYVSITALSTSIFLAGKTSPFFDKEVGKILDFFFLSENLTNFSTFLLNFFKILGGKV